MDGQESKQPIANVDNNVKSAHLCSDVMNLRMRSKFIVNGTLNQWV